MSENARIIIGGAVNINIDYISEFPCPLSWEGSYGYDYINENGGFYFSEEMLLQLEYEGYIHVGWYFDENYQSLVKVGDLYACSPDDIPYITLYAKWIKISPKIIVYKQDLQNIADAIRVHTKKTDQMTISQMANEISNISTAPPLDNVLPYATDNDMTTIFGGNGWSGGYRLSLSGGGIKTGTDYVTGHIPIEIGDWLIIINPNCTTAASNETYVMGFDSSNVKTGALTLGTLISYPYIVHITEDTFTSTVKTIRFSAGFMDENTKIIKTKLEFLEGVM